LLKRTPIFVLSLLLALSVFASVDVDNALELEPNMDQRRASSIATRFLTNYHYKPTRLDDELSSQIFDAYLKLLDPNRIYFLQSDVDDFERYRLRMDDSLRHSDLMSAYEIFNRYTDRVLDRVAYSRTRAQQPFDFVVDESYQYDRENEPWAKNRQELDELWRKRVKNDYLRLKLTDKEGDKIVETLLERYDNLERRINELNSEDVFQFFMNAFAASIEPHTSYLSARNSENFEISMKLSLEGIGALLGRENEYTEISRVVPGGPVSKDGRLKAGDRITAVGQGQDGKMVDIIGWRLDDVVELIRGPKDTVVRLEILPEEESIGGPTQVIEVVRDEVKLEEQAATSEIIEVPVDENGEKVVKVGVIDLPVFYLDFNGRAQNKPDYRSSTRDVRRLIGELEEEGVAGIIIDLRSNGGGSLLEATTLTGLFIDTGPVVQVRNSNGRISVEEDIDPGMAWEGPLAVLVNRYSASASEIFAAAIQDYGRGLVIGETTFGKGTVQSLLDLDDYYTSNDRLGLGQLKITMAQFFRVNGGSTQNRGVEPDISFPTWGDPDDYGERALDNALPWTSIDSARFESAGDLTQMSAVAHYRYRDRMVGNQEFEWLVTDIEEYNQHADETSVSLLESVGRERIAKSEAKKKDREEQRNGGPLLDEESALAGAIDPALGEDPDEEEAAEDEEEDEGPDFLLRESAHIVADMAELGSDIDMLKRQFAQLNDEAKEAANIP
jgi:carboxyl-terminal processing protease